MALLSNKRITTLPQCHWLHDPCLCSWITSHLQAFGQTICDVGAGNGEMIAYLQKHFKRIVTVEPSPDAFRKLQAQVCPPDIVALKSNAESMPIADDSVDVSLSKSSLHHFDSVESGVAEMARISKNAIAIVEVIAPSEPALDFARHILPIKEPGRMKSSIFSSNDLVDIAGKVADRVYLLHFDQFIDVQLWLDNSDIPISSQIEIHKMISEKEGIVKGDMQIHFRNRRLMMLRRMGLAIGAF